VAVILVVCTGNTCRSPMTMALLRHRLHGPNGMPIAIESAGTLGWNDRPATDHTVEVLAEMGVDLSDHVSRRIDPEMLAASDLVLAMTRNHSWAVAAHDPAVMHRTFLLGEIVRLGELEGPRRDLPLRDWVARVDARRTDHKRIGRADDEIADPLGEPVDTYRRTAERVQRSVDRLVALL
jgi:protein-tyrosine phosphatase